MIEVRATANSGRCTKAFTLALSEKAREFDFEEATTNE
jgi:hypothetical protein